MAEETKSKKPQPTSGLVYTLYKNFMPGVTSALEPELLPEGYSAWAGNMKFRGGRPSTRDVYKYIGRLPRGKFQGGGYYSLNNGNIILSVDGRIYQGKFKGTSFSTSEITPKSVATTTALDFVHPAVGDTVVIQVVDTDSIIAGGAIQIGGNQYYVSSIVSAIQLNAINIGNSGSSAIGDTIPSGSSVYYIDVNSAKRDLAYMCQAGNHFLVQDGSAKCIIYDGATSVRSSGQQVPVGTCMAFGNGRLWLATGKKVLAGDLFGLSAESHLYFTENTYLAEGGDFLMPDNITAMAFIPRLDNTTSTGDLYVFTLDTTTTIQATIFDRTQWKDTQGMMKILFPAIGCEGQRSISYANQDIILRSKDGWRTIRNTIVDQQDNNQIPISIDANIVTDNDSESMLKFVSSILFNNRVLFSENPYYQVYEEGFHNRRNGFNTPTTKLIGLDYASIAFARIDMMAAFYGKKFDQPIWEGEHNGLQVNQFIKGKFSGVERCFAICSDTDGENRLYEVTKDDGFDYFGQEVRIPCFIDLKTTDFGSDNARKKLYGSRLFFSNVRGNLDWELQYRPDDYPCWTSWATGKLCVKSRQCDTISGCMPSTFSDGYYFPVKIGTPDTTCNTFDGKDMNNAVHFQFRIKWTGHAKLHQAIFIANATPDAVGGSTCPSLIDVGYQLVDDTSDCSSITCCSPTDGYRLSEQGTDTEVS